MCKGEGSGRFCPGFETTCGYQLVPARWDFLCGVMVGREVEGAGCVTSMKDHQEVRLRALEPELEFSPDDGSGGSGASECQLKQWQIARSGLLVCVEDHLATLDLTMACIVDNVQIL